MLTIKKVTCAILLMIIPSFVSTIKPENFEKLLNAAKKPTEAQNYEACVDAIYDMLIISHEDQEACDIFFYTQNDPWAPMKLTGEPKFHKWTNNVSIVKSGFETCLKKETAPQSEKQYYEDLRNLIEAKTREQENLQGSFAKYVLPFNFMKSLELRAVQQLRKKFNEHFPESPK